MNNLKPTMSQARYIKAIDNFQNKRGYSPGFNDISIVMRVAHNAAFEMMNRLEKKGFIEIVTAKGLVKKITITEAGRAE